MNGKRKCTWRKTTCKHCNGITLVFAVFSVVSFVDSLDWKNYGVDSIIDTVCNHKHLGNGSIILCHNGAKYTAKALLTLIETLKSKGFEFVPLSELIYKENYTMDAEGRQHPDSSASEKSSDTSR